VRLAVDTLRSVVSLRAGQHQGADTGAEQATVGLGLAPLVGDWLGAWNHLRAVAVQALDTILEEIGSLTLEDRQSKVTHLAWPGSGRRC
jgi:hypothetical protein